ncbi:MAG: hypothetical protein AB7V42_12800 [Thermoleophilia bacterium]
MGVFIPSERQPTGTTAMRIGYLLGIVAALLGALASSSDLVRGPAREGEGLVRVTMDQPLLPLAVVAIVLLAAAALLPWLWARLAGLAVVTAVTFSVGFIVVAGRTSDKIALDADVTLLRGGSLLTIAFWVGLAGLIVLLVAFRQTAQAPLDGEPPGAGVADDDPPVPSLKARLSVLLGILGFITIVVSPVAIALAALALGDIDRGEGRVVGRGLAITGMVLGMVALSILVVVFGLGGLTAKPT